MIELSAEPQQVVRDEQAPVSPVVDPATQRAFVARGHKKRMGILCRLAVG